MGRQLNLHARFLTAVRKIGMLEQEGNEYGTNGKVKRIQKVCLAYRAD